MTGPVPPYTNPPIEPQFYEPSRFEIANITRGSTTTVETTEDHNYVLGQLVRLLIPQLYGAKQLNGIQAMVTQVLSSTQVILDIDSSKFNAFIPDPLTATITAATKANPCVLTATNSFLTGNKIDISDVSGMTQLNGQRVTVTRATSTTLTLNIDSSGYSTYTSGGEATLVTNQLDVPQITAIGDFNSGVTNSNGPNVTTYIPGSFINISPA